MRVHFFATLQNRREHAGRATKASEGDGDEDTRKKGTKFLARVREISKLRVGLSQCFVKSGERREKECSRLGTPSTTGLTKLLRNRPQIIFTVDVATSLLYSQFSCVNVNVLHRDSKQLKICEGSSLSFQGVFNYYIKSKLYVNLAKSSRFGRVVLNWRFTERGPRCPGRQLNLQNYVLSRRTICNRIDQGCTTLEHLVVKLRII